MAERVAEFEALGVGVAAVAMSQPKVLSSYLAQQKWPFPIYCDPDRRAYAALGLGRTSWFRFLNPALLGKYIRLILSGAKIRRISEGEDPLQLGGDFLFSKDGRLLWAYRGKDAADRPAVEEILRVVQQMRFDA